jgi:prepilin signal peptidase PulO-like enzyme (type II secretory pathway)
LIDKKLFLIELLSGLIFTLLFTIFSNSTFGFIFAVLLFSLLYLISSFDIKYLLIPDLYSYAVLWVGIIFVLFHNGGHHLYDGILAVIISYVLLKILSLIYLLGFGRTVLGEADPLLAGSLGVWLGWEHLPIFFLAASVFGFIWVLLASAVSKEDIWCQRIPFGPALCCSAALIFIFKNFF